MTSSTTARLTPDQPALDVRGVSKSFAGVRVLTQADLLVRPGSVHALVGHNGSGKSTFIKALAGFHAPDEPVVGSAFGRSFDLGDCQSAHGAGLRFVHQDLGLVDTLSVVDNLALGVGYPHRLGGLIDNRRARQRAREAMHELGYDIDVDISVGHLTPSERAGVAIVRALEEWTGTPTVVVLDEPTASMPEPEVRRLFSAIDRLRQRGLGIVYVSHHLDEILELADDLTVLRGGVVAMSRPVAGLSHDQLVNAIIGRDMAQIARPADQEVNSAGASTVLDVVGLATNTVVDVDLSVNSGEIVGLAGIVGSGRHDVLPAIAGVVRRSGSVRINGRAVRPQRPKRAISAGLGFVPSDRRVAAVLPTFDAGANLTVSGIQEFTRFGLLRSRDEKRDIDGWLDSLDVSPRRGDAPILTLSGGNQQKVMVARWLRRKPALLGLDEPTQGVDVGSKQSIYLSITRTAEEGKGVLISSSDSDELAAICHRVIVFGRGRVIAQLTGDQINAEHIDAISLGAGATA